MRQVVEIVLSATSFGLALFIFLFAKPLPPEFSRSPIDLAVVGLGCFGMWWAVGVMAGYPSLKWLLIVAVLLSVVPTMWKLFHLGPLPLY